MNVNFSTWWENLSLPVRLAGNDVFCWRTFTENKKLATPPLESAIVVQFLFRSHAYLLRNVVRLCAGVAYSLLCICHSAADILVGARASCMEPSQFDSDGEVTVCWCGGKSKVFATFSRCNKPADAILTNIPVKCTQNWLPSQHTPQIQAKPGWKSWIRNANLNEWFALASKKRHSKQKKPGNFQWSIERNWKISKSKFRRN